MTNRFQTLLATTALIAGVGVAATLPAVFATAQDAKPPAPSAAPAAKPSANPTVAPPAGETAAPAEASKPASWIGLPVVTADGQTLGQVTELKAAADGKSQILMIKSPADSKVFAVPSSIAKMTGRAVQLSATSQELKTSVQ
jgi:hypothetical protein